MPASRYEKGSIVEPFFLLLLIEVGVIPALRDLRYTATCHASRYEKKGSNMEPFFSI